MSNRLEELRANYTSVIGFSVVRMMSYVQQLGLASPIGTLVRGPKHPAVPSLADEAVEAIIKLFPGQAMNRMFWRSCQLANSLKRLCRRIWAYEVASFLS